LLNGVPPLTIPFVVPYPTLVFFLLFFAWHCCFSICSSWTQLVQVSLCSLLLIPCWTLLLLLLLFYINNSPL
jgi:hypothetical protein